ncbi:DegV family protein [uncultured Clostridium sp.]|uniref:DegV family protein n=1 Tax=uncultured Clostridium sp. TaxID=59620 RepID=UPI0025907A8C|nr:DegV family protein [uncultured Clostridium sp.]
MRIIVDSTCDLPVEIIEQYGIKVLPLKVLIEDKEYYDRVTIELEEVYEYMRKGVIPKTSQVSPVSFYEAFEEMCEKGEDFIYLAFSSKLSGTHDLGKSILNEFKEKYKNINMEIIDTKSGSTAIGLLVLECIKMNKENLGFFEILERLNEKITHIEHILTLGDLNWLVKGGRIGKTKGFVGTMLDIKPVLDLKDGEVNLIKSIRGKKKTINYILDILEERGIENNNLIGISYAEDLSIVDDIKKGVTQRFGEKEFMINKIGSVLGSHVGLTGVGIFFFNY